MSAAHHWEGEEPNPHDYFGFIYRIDVLETGQAYIGKRQMHTAKRGAVRCKSKVADRQSPRWKESCWAKADWEYYKGSSKYLAKFMKEHPDYTYTYTILKQCRSRGILIYSEAAEQWRCEVLTAKLPNGDYKYFNHAIAGIRFRPNLSATDETKAKMSAAAMGNQNGIGQVISDEQKASTSKRMSERVVSDETKDKIRKANLGKVHSLESRVKRSKSMKGVKKTPEHVAKMAEGNKDKTVYTFIHIETQEEFVGTRHEFMVKVGCSTGSITKVLRGVNKTVQQWKLKSREV